MDGWVDGWMDGLMNEWMDGWMDGWVGGRTDGQIDSHKVVFNFFLSLLFMIPSKTAHPFKPFLTF